MPLFMGWVAWKAQISKLGSSDSLSLSENKEEFTEGEYSSVQLMNFYLDFLKSILNPYTSQIFFLARFCFGSYCIWHMAKRLSV